MTLKELGEKLNKMYNEAQNGEAVVMIHLFGIKFADKIKESEYSKKNIIEASGIPSSYLAELNKGVKLANYVTAKS